MGRALAVANVVLVMMGSQARENAAALQAGPEEDRPGVHRGTHPDDRLGEFQKAPGIIVDLCLDNEARHPAEEKM